MAAANASARGQRAAILNTPLRDLTGFLLTVDCLTAGCGGERSYAVAALASAYGPSRTVGDVLRRMRYSGGCGGTVAAAWLTTPGRRSMPACARPRGIAGPEAGV